VNYARVTRGNRRRRCAAPLRSRSTADVALILDPFTLRASDLSWPHAHENVALFGIDDVSRRILPNDFAGGLPSLPPIAGQRTRLQRRGALCSRFPMVSMAVKYRTLALFVVLTRANVGRGGMGWGRVVAAAAASCKAGNNEKRRASLAPLPSLSRFVLFPASRFRGNRCRLSLCAR